MNRDEPLLYLDYVENEWGNADEYWWDIYSAPGEWLSGRQRVTVYDPLKACDMLRDKFDGLDDKELKKLEALERQEGRSKLDDD